MFVRDEDNHLQTEDAAKASALTNQGELAMEIEITKEMYKKIAGWLEAAEKELTGADTTTVDGALLVQAFETLDEIASSYEEKEGA